MHEKDFTPKGGGLLLVCGCRKDYDKVELIERGGILSHSSILCPLFRSLQKHERMSNLEIRLLFHTMVKVDVEAAASGSITVYLEIK